MYVGFENEMLINTRKAKRGSGEDPQSRFVIKCLYSSHLMGLPGVLKGPYDTTVSKACIPICSLIGHPD